MKNSVQELSAETLASLVDSSAALADSLSSRSVQERGRVLRRTADLFLSNLGGYSDQQVELFDGVMLKLLEHVDREVREYLANRFAALDDGPRGVVRHLANDDAIDVAGPILQQSPCLDDEFLMGCAKSKSQDHLGAIS